MFRIILLILLPSLLSAQNFKGTLAKANSFFFKNHVYVYGLAQNKNDIHFKLYKISNTLQKIDSVEISIGKDKTENYLDITTDTLHNYLNFYLQKTNSKNLVTLIRLTDSLKQIAKVDNIEVTKINSITAFENEKYTFRTSTYTIRTSEDSGGKQFFLNKYTLSNVQKAFEYKQDWQFPFERKYISSAHVFYADSQIVLVSAAIFEGDKKGQWVLKVNSKNGELIKGTRISHKGDPKSFLYTGFYYDKPSKEILMVGNIYTEPQLNFSAKTFNFSGLSKNNNLFFVSIDSLGENIIRNEKTLPIAIATATLPGKPPAKQAWCYHIKIKELQKRSPNDYMAYCTVYKSLGQNLSLLYETGFYLNISITEDGVELIPDKIYSCSSIIPGLVVPDPKDINGKTELLSITDYTKFLFGSPLADVERFYSKDEAKNPKWILGKSDVKTSKTSFYSVAVGAKGLESKNILENSKYSYPNVYKINKEKLLLFNYDITILVFELSIKNW